jgi:hypothetical protein
MLERIAPYPTVNCPCGRTWALSVGGTHAVQMAGPENFATRRLDAEGVHTCHCGQQMRFIRAGQPVPPRVKA